ncbi:TolC family outer membrane protein [Geomonas sp. Red69]|uniref:TolC family outer membrane protein n=1 Tax=Geomonas diazotrophica TaxID=2843197 RepID=A0ABX8JEC0_9BACT|nr:MULTISPECIES: TolC family outer membrane protein [Geomonas]MBU5637804.1 TolC family outer membrane protein [Geomonas diazotrophica]QWV96336.1 TolC family outer membrane protein [Geomonas nitrogeniifigens]QXE85403.1 TolC family outer membrane protein [Geomonas nitrogeniifigens]
MTVLALGMFASAAGAAQAETLQDAVQYMLRSNPEVRANYYNKVAREKEVRQAKAGYLPTMDLSLAAGVTRQHEPTFGTVYPNAATISVRQNVFRFFGTQSEVERQEARARAQQYQLGNSAENNALLASKVYLNVLKSEKLLALAQENLTNHLRIHDQVKLRSESGVDRRADFEQVKGRVALAESNLAAAQANLSDSLADYQAVIGYLPGELTEPQSVGPRLPRSKEEAEELAVGGNQALKSAREGVQERTAQHEAAKSLLYPSLDVALDYRWLKDYNDFPGNREEFLGTATLTFNILNGGWNKARLGQTQSEVYEAEEILENTKRQTVQSIRLSWEANRSAQERIKYLDDYVKAAAQTADAFAAQWSIGRRTMFDLLDTQAELINAKASLVNAQYDQRYAEYRLLNGMSRLLPTLGLQAPDQTGRVTTAAGTP